jgi:hypothetical protein
MNLKINIMEKKLIIWSVIPAVLYVLVCYFKLKNNNEAFYISLIVFVIFLIMLFYKIYALHRED